MPTDPDPNDSEPIVILDREEEVSALPALHGDVGAMPQPVGPDYLTDLAQRSTTLLPGSVALETFAAAHITDYALLAAYGIGAGAPVLESGWSTEAWAFFHRHGMVGRGNALLPANLDGINLPCRDPRVPERVIGWGRLIATKRDTLGAPAGIVCAASLADEPRVVLVDGPLLGLRLAQAGVPGVALVDEAEALVPLREWLAQRDVLLVGRRHARLARICHALGDACPRPPLVLAGETEWWPAEALRLLGLEAGLAPIPSATVTPRLLTDLHAAARSAVARGHGHEVLRALGVGDPELAAVYDLGVLPSGYRVGLDRASARALLGHHLGGAVLVPARDEQGVIVDLWAVHASGRTRNVGPVLAGLIAPSVSTAFPSVVVVDRVAELGRLAREVGRHLLLLRGVEDAQLNAERLRRAGVTEVELRVSDRQADYRAVLEAAGISIRIVSAPTAVSSAHRPLDPGSLVPDESVSHAAAVEPPRPTVSTATLTHHDAPTRRYTFTAAPLTYVAEASWDGDTRMEVLVRGAHGDVLRHRCDLASDAERARFVACLVPMTGAPASIIEADLVAIRDRVLELEAPAPAVPSGPALSDPERADALSWLQTDDLLDRIAADLGELGWVGEPAARRLLYLTAISRKLSEPLWAGLSASAAEPDPHGLRLIAELTPPGEVVPLRALSDARWLHEHPTALQHALVVIDDPADLSGRALMALRQLERSGAVMPGQVQVAAQRPGGIRTTPVVAQGPVAVLFADASRLVEPLASRCHVVPVDESPAQTERILTAQRQRRADALRHEPSRDRRAAIQRRHHHAQRLLEAAEVVIPFAPSIRFPATAVRHRRDQDRFLALLSASALLHQHRRLRDAGRIVADRRDFTIAEQLFTATTALDDGGLGRHAATLLEALWAARCVDDFAMEDVARLMPDWTRYAARAAIAELVAVDCLAATRGGRGRARRYRLTAANPDTSRPRIAIATAADADPVGGLAHGGDADSPTLFGTSR